MNMFVVRPSGLRARGKDRPGQSFQCLGFQFWILGLRAWGFNGCGGHALFCPLLPDQLHVLKLRSEIFGAGYLGGVVMPYFRTELLRNNLDTVWRLRASPTALCNNSVPVCTAEHIIILVIAPCLARRGLCSS